MKTYSQLTEAQQEKAQESALNALLNAILEGAVRFNDELNGDKLQARIDAACEQAEKMQTPWFAGEYIVEAVGDELRGMARVDAEDAIYPERGEFVFMGVA